MPLVKYIYLCEEDGKVVLCKNSNWGEGDRKVSNGKICQI